MLQTVPEDFLQVVNLIFDSMRSWVAIISAQWLLQVVIIIALVRYVISVLKDASSGDKKGGNK